MSRYGVSDGAFVWWKGSKAEAVRFAKALTNQKFGHTHHVVTPCNRTPGKLKVVQTFNPKW